MTSEYDLVSRARVICVDDRMWLDGAVAAFARQLWVPGRIVPVRDLVHITAGLS